MNRLIKIELKSIFSKFDIKATLLLFTFFGIMMGVINKVNNYLSCEGIFEWSLILTLLISALGGLYISRDYTQNTIRNKIIVGHTRFSIYLSKQIAVSLMYLSCVGLFMINSIVSNFIFVGSDGLNKEALLIGILVSIFVIISLSVITTFISMSINKEVGGLMPLLIMFVMMVFSAIGIEFINREIMNIINDILPTSQMMLLNLENVDPYPLRHILYSLLVSFIFFFSGYIIFDNRNLD